MPVLTATNLKHAYGDDIVLDGVSLSVEPGEKIAVVGRNGAGKSTLIKALAGLLSPDSGSVSVQRGCKAGYLGQDPQLDPDETLRTSAEAGLGELHDLHAQLDGVFERMAGAEGDELDKLLKQQAGLEERVERAGGYAVGHRVEAVLHGLGFTDAQFGIKVGSLSGGQRARLGLARLLLEQPDVLLLDEPTNHLDLDGRIWLETFLRDEYRGAVILISHDRYLLDAVVDRIVEVEHARLIEYAGEEGSSYEKFRELRAERRLAQMRMYEKQQTRFKREEAYIRKYKAGQRAKQARGRESLLERERSDAVERPMEVGEMRLSLPKAERTGEVVVSTRGLTKTYTNEGGERVLFKDLDVSVRRGERWGVIGPNGAGKTTLVRAMLGEIEPDAGTIQIGTNVKVGYFRQDRTELDPDLPTYRAIAKAATKHNPELRLSEQESRNLAGAFLFSGEEQDKPVGVLSGGEKSRVALAALLASAKNVLVLDEPTNHLDIPSAERLEEALSADGGFDGTLILISHDRALLDACCDHILALDGAGNAREVIGNYSDWARKRDELGAAPPPLRVRDEPKPAPAPAPKAEKKPARKSRFSWMRTEQIEERMGEIELDIASLDEKLGRPETWTNPAESARLSEKRSKLSAELEELEEEWLHRAG